MGAVSHEHIMQNNFLTTVNRRKEGSFRFSTTCLEFWLKLLWLPSAYPGDCFDNKQLFKIANIIIINSLQTHHLSFSSLFHRAFCITKFYLYQLMHLFLSTLKSLKTFLLKIILHVSIFQDHHQGFSLSLPR